MTQLTHASLMSEVYAAIQASGGQTGATCTVQQALDEQLPDGSLMVDGLIFFRANPVLGTQSVYAALCLMPEKLSYPLLVDFAQFMAEHSPFLFQKNVADRLSELGLLDDKLDRILRSTWSKDYNEESMMPGVENV